MLKALQHGPVTILKTGRDVVSSLVNYYAYCFILGDSLIDTSTQHVEKELLNYLSGQRIKRIINTHHHEDHIGNNLAIERAFGPEVYAYPDAIPLMAAPPPARQRFYLRLMWGYPSPCTAKPLADTIGFQGFSLQVIPTPGHAPDHVCLYEPELKLLFTGDVFCGTRVKYLRADEDFNQQLASIRRLASLEVNTIYCAVAGAVEDGQALLKTKLQFMEEMQGQVLALHGQGLPPGEIRKRLLPKEGLMYWFSAGHFSKQHLIDSILQIAQ